MTLDLDGELIKSKTQVIEMGLRALLERAARKRLRALFGEGPKLRAVRRRRPVRGKTGRLTRYNWR